MKLHSILGLLMAALIAPFAGVARALAPAGLDANNIAGDHDGNLSRIAEAALTVPHLLVTPGTNKATQVIVCTATTRPLGVASDRVAITERAAIERFTGGCTLLMTASKAIAADVDVYTTAGGKITDTAVNNCFRVGRSLAAAAADGDEIEIDPCFPVLTTV